MEGDDVFAVAFVRVVVVVDHVSQHEFDTGCRVLLRVQFAHVHCAVFVFLADFFSLFLDIHNFTGRVGANVDQQRSL